MNKTELISAVAERAAISKKDADSTVSVMIDIIIETVVKEEKAQLISSGILGVLSRNERQGRGPGTNSPIMIPVSKIPTLEVGGAFKGATDR